MPYEPGTVAHGVTHIADVYHSSNVFANFIPVALWDNPSASAAFAAINVAINAPTFAQESAVTEAIEGDADSPTSVDTQQQALVTAGTISQADLDKGTAAATDPAAANTAPPPAGVTEGLTTGTVTVGGTVDETVLYVSALTGITYKVKNVTKQPATSSDMGVIFPYDVATVAIENGYTVQEVCDNLRLMIINCFDPIRKQYPDAFMTCSFRKAGSGSPTSQHPKGMACDIQYSKASKADYYTRALWVKDNTKYDQFLLEYKTTGTGNPWHHISFNKAGNRGQVCTFMNDKNAKGPGVTGLYDLSNA
jgi:hypothetical protein